MDDDDDDDDGVFGCGRDGIARGHERAKERDRDNGKDPFYGVLAPVVQRQVTDGVQVRVEDASLWGMDVLSSAVVVVCLSNLNRT